MEIAETADWSLHSLMIKGEGMALWKIFANSARFADCTQK